MKKSTPAQWATRIILYIIGLFFMAMGVAFAVNSNLGVSPVTSLPYVISLIVNMELGTCVITGTGFTSCCRSSSSGGSFVSSI